MKCYVEYNKLRLVGKAWEVRHYIKQLIRNHSAHSELSSVLPPKQTELQRIHP